ncbi:hypothetical protein MMEU_1363 [Mycobacterium marinum str. Europe]|nr:hypothetical protein MMEU_1363 [Mycobacterium marinum str. Europe]
MPEPMPCLIYRCGQPGTHLLRLAPKSRFPDSDEWPIVPVCSPHHLEYHQAMDGYRWGRRADSSEFDLDTIGEWFDGYRYWSSLEQRLRGSH